MSMTLTTEIFLMVLAFGFFAMSVADKSSERRVPWFVIGYGLSIFALTAVVISMLITVAAL